MLANLAMNPHIPREAMVDVYHALSDAGAPYDICDYGSFAMNAMRMEKAFKGAGELTNEVTLPEADVMRFVKLDKDFIGKEAMEKAGLEPSRFVCAYLEIDQADEVFGHGGEPLYHDGQLVGSTASVAYGPSVDKILAFCYITPQSAVPGTKLEVMVHGKKRGALVLKDAVYDPASALPRALA